jgi:hypothetical protein
LDVDQVAAVLLRGGVPEVVEPDLVEQRGRLEARDVPAQLRRLLVRPQDRGDRVPADERAHAPLHGRVAGKGRLVAAMDGVDVRGRADVLDCRATQPRPLDDALDEVVGPSRPVVLDDGVEGLEPLLSLDSVDVHRHRH